MAGAIDKKINDVIGELKGAPATHIGARAAILTDIALSREFAATFLKAVCQELTGGKDETGTEIGMSLATVCEALAKQRVICYGATSLKGSIRNFVFPPVDIGPVYGDVAGTVNGALGLSEANTSYMGIKATDIAETYTVNLSTTAGTQTQGSNTFSVYVGDYYLVRSRVSGELIDIADDVTPYTTPDGDTVFGNVVAWATPGGGDVSGELEANTWNYNWAKANIASITTQSSGLFNELTVLRLHDNDHLTRGSNTSYTPLGPGFAQKFYLKRHADYVNTFTIAGISTAGTVEITGVSETDLAKVKYGDVISGTGLPADNVSIAAVQTADSKIRLNETGIVTTSGAITLTVNSVPFGFQAHDIFCQIEIVAEGLVTNDNWLPTGNTTKDGTQYDHPNEAADDTLIANTKNFVSLLGFFDPDPESQNPSLDITDLTKGASASYTSDGKEYGGTSYPDIELNPFKPSNQGTTKAYEVKSEVIVGTQPTGLGDKDIWSGRFVRFDFERADNTGTAVGEFRYVTDSAERFYYAPPATTSYGPIGSVTTIVANSVIGFNEPRAELPRSGLGSVINLITKDETLEGGHQGTQTSVPADDVLFTVTGGSSTATSYPSGWSGGSRSITNYRVTGGVIKTCIFKESLTPVTSGGPSAQNPGYTSDGGAWTNTASYGIRSNYVSRKLTTNGSSANADVLFVEGVINELQGTTAGSAKFLDPVMEGLATKHVTQESANDANFNSYIGSIVSAVSTNAVDVALAAVKASLAAFYTAAQFGTRNNNVEAPAGEVLGPTTTNFASFSGQNGYAKWETFSDACDTLETNLNDRIAEIDARIGKPTYAFRDGRSAVSPAGIPPAIYVNTIPSSGVDGALVPYGRSLYNACNHLLGQDVDLLGGIIKDIDSLTDLVGMVETARNKYDIFSGRDKTYT